MSDASPSVPARPSLAAVPRPVEESGEPLSFEDFYRKEHRQVLGWRSCSPATGRRPRTSPRMLSPPPSVSGARWRRATRRAPGSDASPAIAPPRCCAVACVEAKALVRLAKRTPSSIELEEGDEAFWQAVRRLPARQAQAVALYYFEDYSVRDIAAVLDCSEGTVKTHLSRARAAVARHLHLENPR